MKQEELLKQFETFQKQTEAKEAEMRTLQTTMGEMQNENERLKAENDVSKSHRSCTNLIDQYYPEPSEALLLSESS
jgi:regulator of replication initiation timing